MSVTMGNLFSGSGAWELAARLHGFPPDWCSDVPHSDSAEYKLWGNGIALPCIIPMMKAMGDKIKEGRCQETLMPTN